MFTRKKDSEKKKKKNDIYWDPVQERLVGCETKEAPKWLIPFLLPFVVPYWVYGAVFMVTFVFQSLAGHDLSLLSKIIDGQLGPEYLDDLYLKITDYQALANFALTVWSMMIASMILGILTWLGRDKE